MAATHTALGQFGQAAAALDEGLVAMIAALQPSVVQVLAGRVGAGSGIIWDAGGAVVGINAMIFGGDLSVAIPAHIASQFVAVALAEGPTLGIAVQAIELPRSIRAATRVEQGLMVVGVQEGSLAAAAGMYVGDVLLEVFDKPLYDIHTLKYALIARQPGERLTLRLARGEQIQTVVV